MARKNEQEPAQPSPEKIAANLKGLRVQIDKFDLQILDLLLQSFDKRVKDSEAFRHRADAGQFQA